MVQKSTEQFNPFNGYFMAQFDRPDNLRPVNFRAMTSFQRALLVIDGTVTKFIEAYTLEPVEIKRFAQEEQRLATQNSWLKAPENTLVALRQVLIQGKYSSKLFVYALSYVVLERLPEEARNRLRVQGQGIGRVLNDLAMETRRKILWYGREHAKDLPDNVLRQTNGEFFSRSYLIIADGLPIAMINEKFPASIDRLPSPY